MPSRHLDEVGVETSRDTLRWKEERLRIRQPISKSKSMVLTQAQWKFIDEKE
jgi:hypothetical protein